jgi:chemosensory pili system protein ChpA (sensor histidine kinase/response regulator)
MLPGLIMIVDDDEDIRDVVGMLLQLEGFQVATAKDGLDALEKLQAGLRPALVLLDMMMPRMDGETLLTTLRADPELARQPVAVMSGHHAARQKALELGASGCLVKPVELEDLLRLVHRFATPVVGSPSAAPPH